MSRPARPLVIAHRGASAYRPENTLAAYALAVEQGCDMIEIDLHLTLDGAVVVTHDAALDDLGGGGEIAQATLDEVRALDAGDGHRVPTLEEVLDGYGGRVPLNLELKWSALGPYAGLPGAVHAAVRSRGLEADVLYSCFRDGILHELRDLAPEARLGLLVSPRFPERVVERAVALGAEAIHPYVDLVESALVEEAHRAGLAVYVFTVDEPETMDRLFALGVDGVFTNVPDVGRTRIPEPS